MILIEALKIISTIELLPTSRDELPGYDINTETPLYGSDSNGVVVLVDGNTLQLEILTETGVEEIYMLELTTVAPPKRSQNRIMRRFSVDFRTD